MMGHFKLFSLFSILILTLNHVNALPNQVGEDNHLLGNGGDLPDGGKIWALLVAGSSGWFNYRHQADVCHAYHVLSSHGIPDDQIIVMMYDDIANNTMNRDKGTIINRPGGPNVYAGVPKDYTGRDVTPSNFLHILQGEQDKVPKGKKVIKSGPKDNIFVYFSDHGAPGLIAFPHGELFSKQLIKATKNMLQKKRFNKLVYYIEACESGSMFEGKLPKTWNTYATTASNSTSSSFACYFDPHLNVYLGDVYSIMWLQDSDKEDLEKETLEKQFKIVRKETTTSPVHEFGDLDVAKLTVGQFQGTEERKEGLDVEGGLGRTDACKKDAVDNREAYRISLERTVQAARTKQEKKRAKKLLKHYKRGQRRLIKAMLAIVDKVTSNNDDIDVDTFSIAHDRHNRVEDEDCYMEAVQHFKTRCPRHYAHDYRTAVYYMLVNLCNAGYGAMEIAEAAEEVCSN